MLDSQVPGEAGLGLNPDLKVILMSGYANTPSRLVLDRRIDTLRKPFDLNDLRHRVEYLATVHQARALISKFRQPVVDPGCETHWRR